MRALVIDDSKPVRSILGRMFDDLGFEVAWACHGQDGLDQLQAGPLPDIVTVNWNMPVMDGVEFIKSVRLDSRYSSLPVVMISSEADPTKVAEAKSAGANGYLVKPLETETLRSAIRLAGVSLPGVECEEPTDTRLDPPRAANRLGILVVDDSVVIRSTLTKVLEEDPELQVLGTAADGQIALDFLSREVPDAILLDVEMPNMNGLEALERLRKSHPKLPVIMFSSLTERGAAATLDALMLGADDYVPKPAGVGSFNIAKQCICDELIPRIKQLAGLDRRAISEVESNVVRVRSAPARRRAKIDVVVIGVSTGGPMALARMLPQLMPRCGVPVVIVQHMPPVFTRHLADRLSQIGTFGVEEGLDGQALENGSVVIAPGGSHVVLVRRGDRLFVQLNQEPPEHSCRPAADVLFRSAAAVCGPGTLAVVMTGMGKDGLSGCRTVIEAGGQVLAQDEPSSVVWGMPGQVVQAGLADAVVPLADLGAAIADRVP